MTSMWKEAGKWVVQSSDVKGPPSPPKGKRGSTSQKDVAADVKGPPSPPKGKSGSASQKDVTADVRSPPGPTKGSRRGDSSASLKESGGNGESGSSIFSGYM